MKIVEKDDEVLNWFHHELSNALPAYAAIEEGLRTRLDTHFDTKSLNPIENVADILERLSTEEIRAFRQPVAWD